jgi:hypothetical protein
LFASRVAKSNQGISHIQILFFGDLLGVDELLFADNPTPNKDFVKLRHSLGMPYEFNRVIVNQYDEPVRSPGLKQATHLVRYTDHRPKDLGRLCSKKKGP